MIQEAQLNTMHRISTNNTLMLLWSHLSKHASLHDYGAPRSNEPCCSNTVSALFRKIAVYEGEAAKGPHVVTFDRPFPLQKKKEKTEEPQKKSRIERMRKLVQRTRRHEEGRGTDFRVRRVEGRKLVQARTAVSMNGFSIFMNICNFKTAIKYRVSFFNTRLISKIRFGIQLFSLYLTRLFDLNRIFGFAHLQY